MTILSRSVLCVAFTKTCWRFLYRWDCDFFHNLLNLAVLVRIQIPQWSRLNRFSTANTVFLFPFLIENLMTVRTWVTLGCDTRFKSSGWFDNFTGANLLTVAAGLRIVNNEKFLTISDVVVWGWTFFTVRAAIFRNAKTRKLLKYCLCFDSWIYLVELMLETFLRINNFLRSELFCFLDFPAGLFTFNISFQLSNERLTMRERKSRAG